MAKIILVLNIIIVVLIKTLITMIMSRITIMMTLIVANTGVFIDVPQLYVKL